MKEDIIQIFVDNGYLYALCKSGKIYRKDADNVEHDWEPIADSPKNTYRKAR